MNNLVQIITMLIANSVILYTIRSNEALQLSGAIGVNTLWSNVKHKHLTFLICNMVQTPQFIKFI